MKHKTARLLFALSLAAAILSGLALLRVWWKDSQTMRYWRQLADLQTEATDGTGRSISPRFRALYERNGDIVGWLSMEDALIDYPVMQTAEDPEYYLRRNFGGEDDYNGTPFADARCRVTPAQGFNTVIYLHDYAMRWLKQYAYTQGYYEKHRYFHFDTLTEEGTYQVAAAFYADGTDAVLLDPWVPDHPQSYDFYNYLEPDSPEGLRKYTDQLSRLQLLEDAPEITGRAPLVTLVCCASEGESGIPEHGRFVVIGQRVPPRTGEPGKTP